MKNEDDQSAGINTDNNLRSNLKDFLNIKGVIACAVFSEGIPIDSISTGDFDLTSSIVSSEDLLSSCNKIANGRGNKKIDSMTLEMDDEKLIVIPIGEVGLMILTKQNVSLGLLRLKINMTIENIKKLNDLGEIRNNTLQEGIGNSAEKIEESQIIEKIEQTEIIEETGIIEESQVIEKVEQTEIVEDTEIIENNTEPATIEPTSNNEPSNLNKLPEIEYNVAEYRNPKDGYLGFDQVVKNHSDFAANIDIEIEHDNSIENFSLSLPPNATDNLRFEPIKENVTTEIKFRALSNGIQVANTTIAVNDMENMSSIAEEIAKEIIIKEFEHSDENNDIHKDNPFAKEIASVIGIDLIKKVKKMPKINSLKKDH